MRTTGQRQPHGPTEADDGQGFRRASPSPFRAAALAVAVGLTAAFALTARAQDGGSAAAGLPDPIVIGVENVSYLPLSALAEDGTYVGYARDLLDAFAADAGLTLDYRPMPVPRLYASLAAGRIDAKFPDNPDWNAGFREPFAFHYSEPVVDVLDASVVPAGREDISPDAVTTLGTVTGFSPWPWLDRVEAGTLTLVENADFGALVRQVLAGRVDAAYASIAVVNRVLDEDLGRPGALVMAPGLPHDFGQYRLSTIAHPALVARFDAWMEANADTVAALKARYDVERGVTAPAADR
jgi:ABC-type amino acid transport substrate-binding protein